MKLFICSILCVIAISNGKTTDNPSKVTVKLVCEGVTVNGTLHKRRILMNGINRPYQLAMYDAHHQLFFSYNVGEDTKDTFGIAYVKEHDTMPNEVHGIKNGFALAVNRHGKKIYFGGNDGVYQADLTKFEGVKYIIENKDIWDIFYHENKLYFIEYPSQHLHVYDIEKKNFTKHEHIKEKIYQFVIDGDHDTFITTKEGLFEIKSDTNKTIPYSGPKVFRAIEMNHMGVAYFCAKNGIYIANKSNHTLIEIASIKNIFGLTFDAENNIIYSNPHEIVKLLPHNCK